MIINPVEEKKVLAFLSDLVALYEKHGVTTEYDYDYCAFIIGDRSIGFPEYHGEGFVSHSPNLLPDGREKIQEIGEELFGKDIVKRVDLPDADKIYPAGNTNYRLVCYAYPDSIKYVIAAGAYNEKKKLYEEREKVISVSELLQ